MCYSAGYLSKEIFRTLSSQYSSHRNLYCCIFTVATAQASSAIPNVCCIHPSAVLTSTGQDPGSSLLSLLYTFILYLGTIVSSLYPNFLRQALSLTIASHAGYSPLPPSASTQVSNISTQCNWPHLALLLPPAPASLSSSVLYPSTQYQRPSPPPHILAAAGALSSLIQTPLPLPSPRPLMEVLPHPTLVHLSSRWKVLSDFIWQSWGPLCTQRRKKQPQPGCLPHSLHRLYTPC